MVERGGERNVYRYKYMNNRLGEFVMIIIYCNLFHSQKKICCGPLLRTDMAMKMRTQNIHVLKFCDQPDHKLISLNL